MTCLNEVDEKQQTPKSESVCCHSDTIGRNGGCSAVWSGTFPHPPHRLVPSFVQLLLAHAPFRSLASPPAWVAIAAIQSHSRMTNTLQRHAASQGRLHHDNCTVPHTLACTLIGVPLTSGIVGGDIVVRFADSVRRRRADWRCWLDRQICQLIEWVTTHLICVHASHAVHGVLITACMGLFVGLSVGLHACRSVCAHVHCIPYFVHSGAGCMLIQSTVVTQVPLTQTTLRRKVWRSIHHHHAAMCSLQDLRAGTRCHISCVARHRDCNLCACCRDRNWRNQRYVRAPPHPRFTRLSSAHFVFIHSLLLSI